MKYMVCFKQTSPHVQGSRCYSSGLNYRSMFRPVECLIAAWAAAGAPQAPEKDAAIHLRVRRVRIALPRASSPSADLSHYTVRVAHKLSIALAVLLLLACSVTVVWSALDLPPPLWILKYGPTPGCEPEGVTTVGGVEFIVIGPGIARVGSSWLAENGEWDFSDGDLVGRVLFPLKPEWGEPAAPSWEMPVHWVEFPEGFALAKTEITNAQYERFDPEHKRSESLTRRHGPGRERELEGREGVLRLAGEEVGPAGPAAERVGVGSRLPGASPHILHTFRLLAGSSIPSTRFMVVIFRS